MSGPAVFSVVSAHTNKVLFRSSGSPLFCMYSSTQHLRCQEDSSTKHKHSTTLSKYCTWYTIFPGGGTRNRAEHPLLPKVSVNTSDMIPIFENILESSKFKFQILSFAPQDFSVFLNC